MKRIGGLKQQLGAGVQTLSVDGRTPAQQIEGCYAVVRGMVAELRQLARTLFNLLERAGIRVAHFDSLSREEQAMLREHYRRDVFPLITPLAIDPAHPFPFISNLSVNLLVTVRCPETGRTTLIRIKVPTGAGAPRFAQVGKDTVFVPLEDLIAKHLLFPGVAIESCELFQIARNAITERSEEKAAWGYPRACAPSTAGCWRPSSREPSRSPRSGPRGALTSRCPVSAERCRERPSDSP